MSKPSITVIKQNSFKRASCRTRIDNVWHTVEVEQSVTDFRDGGWVLTTTRVIRWRGRNGFVIYSSTGSQEAFQTELKNPKLRDLLKKVAQASCLTIGDVRKALAARGIGVG